MKNRKTAKKFIVYIKLKLMFLKYSLKCVWLFTLITLQKQKIIQFASYYLCLIKQGFNLYDNNYLFISISNMIISKVEDCHLNILLFVIQQCYLLFSIYNQSSTFQYRFIQQKKNIFLICQSLQQSNLIILEIRKETVQNDKIK
ncbi:unnamed protein product [Paramecium primaurelia]|uniref:Uncharacterized protein n=1 Tax=Paramecium primaurelia TaxID=5886 RepID=A0A8S1MR60_PARPR|nr:unnamed protein product [Paramecium primaurelia]